MSLPAILQATRDHLQAILALDPLKNLGVFEDGQPPPFTGDVYYAIHPTDWAPHPDAGDNVSLDEAFGIAVTITVRKRGMPRDKAPQELWLKAFTGLDKRLRQVMLAIAGPDRYTLQQRANTLMAGDVGLSECFRWLGSDPMPVTQDGSWFWSEPEADAGWTMTARFGGMRRIQKLFKSPADNVE